MTATMAATPRQPISLLDLPAELRKLIYGYVAAKDEPINVGVVYTSDFTFERILISEYPSLASVSKQLRDEVLPLYYSTNKFILGDDPQQTDSSSQYATVDKWRRFLGQYARDLRDVTIANGNLRTHSDPYCSPRLYPYEHLATRARFPQTGAMIFEQTSGGTHFCTYWLRRYVAKRGLEDNTPSKDGRQLLQVLEDCVEDVEFHRID